MTPGLPGVSENPNSQIALRLRSFYRSIQEEDVPQRFLDLLEKLDAAEQRFNTRASD
ncbi:NepR family anti-sigma factor [Sinorhizobium sp. BG8]|uniref:NepR family anti-sigma factor n=1 Tax=Sinorhizobium sp. BG8 TaxID=2613773 RepID=UPI00193DB400|nr:NepR family anti-sigma factor [Sinorhizobium sp. BG8]